MMSRIQKGMVAGFTATLAVSVMEAVNLFAGPWFTSFPALLAHILQVPGIPIAGWIAHFAVGTLVLGPVFGILCPRLPTDTTETKGILFAVGAWILMMLTVAPAAGIGVFAAMSGFPTMAWMLATHIVFGVVLGIVYARLIARERRMAAHPASAAPAH